MVIPYQKCQSPAQAMQAVKESTPKTLEKFQVRADICDNGRDEICAKGKGFDLVATFGPSDVQVKLKLSLLLRPLQRKIEGYLQKSLERVL